jgi:hypothetical protein
MSVATLDHLSVLNTVDYLARPLCGGGTGRACGTLRAGTSIGGEAGWAVIPGASACSCSFQPGVGPGTAWRWEGSPWMGCCAVALWCTAAQPPGACTARQSLDVHMAVRERDPRRMAVVEGTEGAGQRRGLAVESARASSSGHRRWELRTGMVAVGSSRAQSKELGRAQRMFCKLGLDRGRRLACTLSQLVRPPRGRGMGTAPSDVACVQSVRWDPCLPWGGRGRSWAPLWRRNGKTLANGSGQYVVTAAGRGVSYVRR